MDGSRLINAYIPISAIYCHSEFIAIAFKKFTSQDNIVLPFRFYFSFQ